MSRALLHYSCLLRTSGFTMVELMVVLAIVGVLASTATVNYLGFMDRARAARSIMELQTISRAIDPLSMDGAPLPGSLAGIADNLVDPWGNPYQYLRIQGGLPPAIASTADGALPAVSAAPDRTHAATSKTDQAGADTPTGQTDGGAPTIAQARKDQFLVPINSDYDLYSMGPDGESRPTLQAPVSRDDVIRASNGGFFGIAESF